MISFSPVLATYNSLRYPFILATEQNGKESFTVYTDSKGYATIGAGFFVSSSAKAILDQMYQIDMTEQQRRVVAEAIKTATDGKNFGQGPAGAASALSAINKAIFNSIGLNLTFAYVDTDQIRATFDVLVETFESTIDSWFGVQNGTIPDTKDRLALLSLAYNGVLTESSSLKKAILEGNRAEAWYQIRYNTNRIGWACIKGNAQGNDATAIQNGEDKGIAKRRFYESEVFGLYDSFDQAKNETEALQVYRMYTAHRDKILQYEALYGNVNGTPGTRGDFIAKANSDYHLDDDPHDPLDSKVHTLHAELFTSADVLMNVYIKDEYGRARDFNPLNIQVSSLNAPILLGEDTTVNTGSIDDLLIGSDERNDIIGGESGNDILIGGAGADTLEGGKGDDILVGGKGNDTFIWNTGDGNDRIIEERDEDGKYHGIITINYGPGIELQAAGGFIREGTSNIWTMIAADGSILTLTHNSPWKLILADGSTLELGDFQDGDFGMRLFEKQEAERTLTGTDGDDVVWGAHDTSSCYYIFSGEISGNVSTYWLYGYKMFNYSAYSVAPKLHIAGNGGNDHLAGLAGQDYISGGIGEDVIVGEVEFAQIGSAPDEPAWMGTGTGDLLYGDAGRDLVFGWYGDDMLYGGDDGDFLDGGIDNDTLEGGAGDDVMVGGSGDDLLNGGAGNDILLAESSLNFPSEVNSFSLLSVAGMGFQTTFGENGYAESVAYQRFWVTQTAAGGEDVLAGGAGNDILAGGAGNDTLMGEVGHDRLEGGAGDDTLSGGTGNDLLLGDDNDEASAGRDTLTGGDGADLLYGFGGDDLLAGGAGDDLLFGGAGSDVLAGDGGIDYLDGGAGDDVYLFGPGSGQDFIYETGTTAADTVRFTGGIGPDMIAVQRSEEHLILSIVGSNDYLGLINWFADGVDSIERLEFADGTVWDRAAIDNLLATGGNPGGVIPGVNPSLPVPEDGTYVNGRCFRHPYDLFNTGGPTGWNLAYWLYWQAQRAGESPSGDETLSGSDYADYLYGGIGNDYLYGEGGDDYLAGAGGNDRLYGGGGQDRLEGGEGEDKLYGNEGNDTLDGGVDDDYLYGEDGDDYLAGSGGHDVLYGGTGQDLLIGGDGEDSLFGEAGNDTLDGGAGNDSLRDYYGNNIIYGGDGDDELISGAGDDIMDGGSGNDYLQCIYGGNDRLEGGEGDDHLWGYIGNDTLNGGAGNDDLCGSAGNDILDGGAGDDSLWGGDGDDIFLFGRGSGHDSIDDGCSDILQFAPGIGPDDLIATRSRNPSGDLILTIADTGDSVAIKSWFFTYAARELQVKFSDGTLLDMVPLEQTPLIGTDQDDKSSFYISDDTSLHGGQFNDVIDGRAGNDEIYGANGDDVYQFGRGDGQDVIYDSSGLDTIRFKSGIAPADVTIRQDSGNLCLDINSSGDGITIKHQWIHFILGNSIGCEIERVEFSDGTVWDESVLYGNPFLLQGTEEADVMGGTANDDIFSGLGGDDIIGTGPGNDTLAGGAGDDNLNGGEGNDIFEGGAGNDRLSGDSGNDTFVFGLGDGQDTIWLDDIVGIDTLAFKEGIGVADLYFNATNYNLQIVVGEGDDLITVSNWYNPNRTVYRLDRFTFADGTILEGDALTSLIDSPPENAAPVVDAPLSLGEMPEAGTLLITATSLLENASDSDGDELDVVGLTASSGTVTDNGDGTWSYTSAPQFHGNVVFSYTVTDGLDEVAAQANLVVVPVNSPPSVAGDTMLGNMSAGESRVLTAAELLASVADADGDPLTIVEITVDRGTLLANGDGTWSYTADSLFTGDVGFSFQVTDGTAVVAAHASLAVGPASQDIVGSSGNDTLTGTGEGNCLRGLAGDDTISGREGNDILIGGVGNDVLSGGAGDDEFLFYPGDGQDTIQLDDIEGFDTLAFGAGITPADLQLQKTGAYDLVIKVGKGDDQVKVTNWFHPSYTEHRLDRFSFADGTILTLAELLAAKPVYSIGTAANDSLQGHEGMDSIFGEAGNDYLYGYAGNDTLSGGEGSDNLMGDDGDDLLDGGQGIDTLTGGAGNDALAGNVGNDTLDGGTGNDIYLFSLGDGADTINNYDTAGIDTVSFGAGVGLADLDLIKDGNNLLLRIGSNGDQLTINNWFSGAMYQVDRFVFADGTIKSGFEILAGVPVHNNGTAANDSLSGYEGIDIISGGAGNDYLYGYAGNDTLSGGDGSDNLQGGDGDDMLDGGLGVDNISGGSGNDTLTGGIGNDILDGGVGNDTYLFNMGDGADTINNYDTTGVDTISFGAGIGPADINLAKDGNNLILRIGSNGDQVAINNWFSGANYQLDRFVFTDGTTKSGAEILASLPVYGNGTEANDTLSGYEGVDIMSGGAGNDYLYGYADNDTLSGGDGSDNLQGGDGDDLLEGGLGIDNISGDSGHDTLAGGIDNDTLDGGAGNDTYVFTLGDGADTINNYDTTGLDTLSFGTGIGLADMNLATKIGNNLTLQIGGDGNQVTLNNWFSGANYQIDRFVFTDGTVKSGAEILAALPVYENGTTANDSLSGYEGVDIMSGGAGNDYLYSYAGNDLLSGGEGNDNLQAGDGDDQLDGDAGDDILGGGNGSDVLAGGLGIDNLSGDAGNDILTGGLGNDTLSGGTGDDLYVFNLGDGADTINNYDTTGVDTISFGSGLVPADINNATKENNNLLLSIGSNGDRLTMTNWFAGTAYQIDRFAFADGTVKNGGEILAALPVYENGTTANDSLSGYEGVDIMSGGVGNDYLYGYAGNDTLSGGDGNDNLQAGDGDDQLDSGSGDDTLAGGNGSDLLTGGLGIDNLTGDAGNDILTGGLGNDTLAGSTGDDIYMFNLGDGADAINNYDTTGVDIVSFGSGLVPADINNATKESNNLILSIGSNGDRLTITNWFAGTAYQIDRFAFEDGTVKSGGEILAALPVYENGTTANDSLSGYEGVDIMSGGAGNDYLYGYAGNDRLNGGEGNDTLSGGAGNDTFVFDTFLNQTTNKDSISDFVLGQDKIELDTSIFTVLPAEGTLASYSFLANAGGTAADDNDYILYNTTSGALLYDADGNGLGVAIEFATLTNKPAIKAEDFIIVS